MTITARYASKCATCGGSIREGERIEWVRGQPARHIRCSGGSARPRTSATRRPTSSRTTTDRHVPMTMTDEQALIACGDPTARISDPRAVNEWTAGDPRRPGEIVSTKKHGWQLVIETSASYHHSETECEDQDCFCGHYGRRYPYTTVSLATCAAAVSAAQKTDRAARLREIARLCMAGERCDDTPLPDGTRIPYEPPTAMGPAAVIVVEGDAIHAWSPGSYDDWQRSHGIIRDAQIAAEIATLTGGA